MFCFLCLTFLTEYSSSSVVKHGFFIKYWPWLFKILHSPKYRDISSNRNYIIVMYRDTKVSSDIQL